MFGYSYRYVEGKDGRHYCFATEPSFECAAALMDPDDERLVKLAGELGVRPVWLAGKLRHAADRKRDEHGKLVNECATCGHKLVRKGFRRWIEAPGDDKEMGVRINKRLGGDGFVTVEGPWYSPTKADARAWAYGRAKNG